LEDPDGRWAITVPATWECTLASNGVGTTDALCLVTPAADPARWAEDPGADALLVMIMPGVTLPQVIEMWREVRDDDDVDPVAQHARALAGQPADESVFDMAADGVARRVRIACTSVGGALYMVIHAAAVERYEAEERQVSAALDSFELLAGSAFAPSTAALDAAIEAHVQEVTERERRAAHADDPPPQQAHESIGHRLGSLFHRRGGS
jgi:hypothetical protein